MCYYGDGGSRTKRVGPEEKWKEVVDKDMNDLHPKTK